MVDRMTDRLAGIMETWLNAKPMRNKSYLARISGVGDATIGKILRRERKVSSEVAIAIITEIADSETAREFLSEFIHPLRSLLNPVTPTTTQKLAESPFLDQAQFVCMTLASTGGTSRQNITDHLGKRGLKALDELLERGFLREDADEFIHSRETQFFVTNPRILIEEIQHLCQLFDFDGIDEGQSTLAVKTASVSDGDLKVIFKKLRETYHDITEIANRSTGNNRLCLGILATCLEGIET